MKLHKKLALTVTTAAAFYPMLASSLFSIAAATSSAISQSYQTNVSDITQGTLVSLATSKSGLVVPASGSSASTLIGIAASKPLVQLSSDKPGSVQVAVGGTVNALVSDINGPVKSGDKITASPISGIGMKATLTSEIVGTAQTSLQSVKTVAKNFATTDGKNASVQVGLLPVAINVSYYSATSQSSIAAFLPPFLQSIANTLTGKQVSPLRVLLGTCALVLGFIAVTVMLYVAIRSQLISIGRNPLAESAIRKGLIDAIVAAIGVLIITVGVVYGVLFS